MPVYHYGKRNTPRADWARKLMPEWRKLRKNKSYMEISRMYGVTTQVIEYWFNKDAQGEL